MVVTHSDAPTGLPQAEIVANAAGIFKTLGNESRLRLLILLDEKPYTVTALAEAAGLSQPLVSQHLRTLRTTGLVVSHQAGREVTYAVADEHVTHVIKDTLIHTRETRHLTHDGTDRLTTERNTHD